jgi:hypothetical protein
MAPAAILPDDWFGGGLGEVELEAVIGCDSAAGADSTSLSAGLVESLSSEGDRWMLDEVSTDCCGSGGGESVPFVGGHEVCNEPEALERRERSLAISRFLAVGFQRLVLMARLVWKRFPQDTKCEKRWSTRLSNDECKASTHQRGDASDQEFPGSGE